MSEIMSLVGDVLQSISTDEQNKHITYLGDCVENLLIDVEDVNDIDTNLCRSLVGSLIRAKEDGLEIPDYILVFIESFLSTWLSVQDIGVQMLFTAELTAMAEMINQAELVVPVSPEPPFTIDQ